MLHKEISEDYENFVPRNWQNDVIELIKKPTDPRKINWIWEKYGNVGKSELMNYLCIKHNAIELSGKVADMAFTYNGEPIVCFDIPRTAEDNGESIRHLYNFAEKLKNGRIVSTKYESSCKIFKKPHIIFFANFECDYTVWSKDRYNVIDLNYLKGNPDNESVEKTNNFNHKTEDSLRTQKEDGEYGLEEKTNKKFSGNTILRTFVKSNDQIENESEIIEGSVKESNDNIEWFNWDCIEESWLDSCGNTYKDIKLIPSKYLDISNDGRTTSVKREYVKDLIIRSNKSYKRSYRKKLKTLIPNENEISMHYNNLDKEIPISIIKLDNYYERYRTIDKKEPRTYNVWYPTIDLFWNKKYNDDPSKIPNHLKNYYNEFWRLYEINNNITRNDAVNA